MIEKLNLSPEQQKRCEGLHLTDESKLKIVNSFIKNYNRINKELEKYRDCSALKDGWQKSSLAKKQRKAEVLSKEKTIIRNILFDDWNIEI